MIKRKSILHKLIFSAVILCLIAGQTGPALTAQERTDEDRLLSLTPDFVPARLMGIKVFSDNPLKFDFIVDCGNTEPENKKLEKESSRLIKYFLASLTVPEKELWVNLSPFEKHRMIPDKLGRTEMGRDLLAQDYILKQLTASLMYPEKETGCKFWGRVYAKAKDLYGTAKVPVDTFNKVWIIPDKAVVYQSGDTAFIIESHLKVMLEKDYLALKKNLDGQGTDSGKLREKEAEQLNDISTAITREVVLPEIEKEVNNGEHFANLRQIYHSLILAAWFKRNLKESLLARVYADENKVGGVESEDQQAKEKIYEQYVRAYEQGVYNYIKEDYDPATRTFFKRRYFSGGFEGEMEEALTVVSVDPEAALEEAEKTVEGPIEVVSVELDPVEYNSDKPGRDGGSGWEGGYSKLTSLLSGREDRQGPAGPGDEYKRDQVLSAGPSARTDPALFDEENSVALEEYISYRKIFRADPVGSKDVREAVISPEKFKEVVESNSVGLEPAKIDFLITRQAPIEQSVLELVSNASDAMTGRSSPIGRFGVGAMQMLAFVLDENNPVLGQGAHIIVDTRTAEGNGRRVVFFKGRDGKIKFNITESSKKTTGTRVNIRFPGEIDPEIRTLLERFLQERLNLFTRMRINLNGRLLNPLDDHIFLNGDKVHYDHPEKSISIKINNQEIVVEDTGSGMNDEVLLDKYLIPRLGENQEARKQQTEDDIARDVHLFYKGPRSLDEESTTRIVFQVSGINIQSIEIKGYGLPAELIIQLPSSTKLTVSRDHIEIDESTHTAVRAMAQKIIKGDPIHQTALVNGFMQAVKLLDEHNTRIEALQPLVDTVREMFIPFVMQKQGLVLPNDKLFRQMDVPEDTLFLDPDITYNISPQQIPGANDISHAFRPGRLKKAFTVPFKEGAKVTYLESGPYLLLNEKIYNKYRNFPMFLNLRLNFYVGYGRKSPDKGWILSDDAIEEKQQKEVLVLPLLEGFPALENALSEEQIQWLQICIQKKNQDGAHEGKKNHEGIAGSEVKVEGEKSSLVRAEGETSPASEEQETDEVLLEFTQECDVLGRPGDTGQKDEPLENFQLKGRPLSVDPKVDVSEVKFKALFQKLNEFIEKIPEHMRDQVDLEYVLPFWGTLAIGFEKLLLNPDRILLPDTEFLSLHSAYFLNQDHPGRINRYLKNLLRSGYLKNGRDQAIIHKIISQIDERGLDYIDGEVIDQAAKVFENRNLENMEDAFEAVNAALSYVNEEGIKRVIMRWLRIYDSDPKSAEKFYDLLSERYEAEKTETKRAEKIEEVPIKPFAEYKKVDLGNFPQTFRFAAEVNGKLIYTSFQKNRAYFYVLDLVSEEMELLTSIKVGRQDEIRQDEIYSVFFTGEFLSGMPIFGITSSNEHMPRLYRLNIEEKVCEVIKDWGPPLSGPHEKQPENKYRREIIQTDLKDRGGENLLLLTFPVEGCGYIGSPWLMFYGKRDKQFGNYMLLGFGLDSPYASVDLVTDGRRNLAVVVDQFGKPHFYNLDLENKRLRKIEAYGEITEYFEKYYGGMNLSKILKNRKTDAYSSIRLINSDDQGNLVFAAVREDKSQVENVRDLILFNLNLTTGEVSEIARGKDSGCFENVDDVQVLERGDVPLILIKESRTYGGKDRVVVARIDLEAKSMERVVSYSENIWGEDIFRSVRYDPESQVLTVATMSNDKYSKELVEHEKSLAKNGAEFDRSEGNYHMQWIDILSRQIDYNLYFFDFKGEKRFEDIDKMRTGFQALREEDDLSGIPPLAKAIVRFLKEEDAALIEEENPDERGQDWETTGNLLGPVSLALLNYLYERMAGQINENRDITLEELSAIISRFRGKDLKDYVSIIRSAIEGQDKTQRAWVREIAVQNSRDATRRAREERGLGPEQGEIHIRNFTNGEDWVFSVRDYGTGMDLWHLVRYFFPLDQSSKDYLSDTGNLGQGNYTLFADFDRVFIRTSTGNGVIIELEIVRDEENGPVIERWEALQGDFKGTEIRRIKSKGKSDPQLESLFIQEALERFAGAIQSPESRREKGLNPEIRDVRILYNGEQFSEDIDVIESSQLGGDWGEISLARAKKGYRRVVQDGIFIKEPDQKELKFVPKWLEIAFERFGGLHINLPRNILLNIPRTGYSQEHKFIHRLQAAVLHNVIKTILRDYIDRGTKIPGMPPDYFYNSLTRDKGEAERIAFLMHEGKYDEIAEEMLTSFLNRPDKLFELLSHIPFTSEAYDGEVNLHEIRERFMEQSRLRARRTPKISMVSRALPKKDYIPRGEFAADIREAAGDFRALSGGTISGRMGALFADMLKQETMTVEKFWKQMPEGARTKFEYLIMRLIKPIVGDDMPYLNFYYKPGSPISAFTTKGETISFNLANIKKMMQMLMSPQAEGLLIKELRNSRLTDQLSECIDTLAHESQHLKQFEEPGDHTHHAEEKIEGFEGKNDTFGPRMGRALDEILFDLDDDVLSEFFPSQEKMESFIRENNLASSRISGIFGKDGGTSQPKRRVENAFKETKEFIDSLMGQSEISEADEYIFKEIENMFYFNRDETLDLLGKLLSHDNGRVVYLACRSIKNISSGKRLSSGIHDVLVEALHADNEAAHEFILKEIIEEIALRRPQAVTLDMIEGMENVFRNGGEWARRYSFGILAGIVSNPELQGEVKDKAIALVKEGILDEYNKAYPGRNDISDFLDSWIENNPFSLRSLRIENIPAAIVEFSNIMPIKADQFTDYLTERDRGDMFVAAVPVGEQHPDIVEEKNLSSTVYIGQNSAALSEGLVPMRSEGFSHCHAVLIRDKSTDNYVLFHFLESAPSLQSGLPFQKYIEYLGNGEKEAIYLGSSDGRGISSAALSEEYLTDKFGIKTVKFIAVNAGSSHWNLIFRPAADQIIVSSIGRAYIFDAFDKEKDGGHDRGLRALFSTGSKEDLGGIDLNPEMLELQTQGQYRITENDQSSLFRILQEMPIDGFTPVIIKIAPADLPLFLGIKEEDTEGQQLTSVR